MKGFTIGHGDPSLVTGLDMAYTGVTESNVQVALYWMYVTPCVTEPGSIHMQAALNNMNEVV